MGCGGTQEKIEGNAVSDDYYSPEQVSKYVADMLDVNYTVTSSSMPLAGVWYGKKNYMKIALFLDENGSFRYKSVLLLGKYHNVPRVTYYDGTWELNNSNSQIVLNLENVDAPLVISNRFPLLYAPSGIRLYPGKGIDVSVKMDIDPEKDVVNANYTQNAKNYMNRSVWDYSVDYFTMCASKANSVEFWKSVEMPPPGYNYGHKFDPESDDFKYAKKRMEDDSSNYVMVISDENWQVLIGNRHRYTKDIQDPVKMYRWLEYFKDQMQILGSIKGPVLYIIAGDAPAYWASDVRLNHSNDAKTIPAKLIQSRFPEVLERNPDNSFAGVFQMMDYLRLKYAPNVKIGYTIKTWGIAEKDIYHEPEGGWDDRQSVKVMADYLNSFGVQFDFLAFNFNPRKKHTQEEYESGAKYFGAISRQLKMRDSNIPKLWIWKLSLWNEEQTSFMFSHIDFLVNECNAIGMTLGHGNDLVSKSGFSDENGIYLKSWIEEYYKGEEKDIPVHAHIGPVYWR